MVIILLAGSGVALLLVGVVVTVVGLMATRDGAPGILIWSVVAAFGAWLVYRGGWLVYRAVSRYRRRTEGQVTKQ
jgi:hypothetical protein